MLTQKEQMFYNRLLKVYKHRSKQAKQQNISCYRLYDHDIPEFPFSIDIYEGRLSLSEYRRRHHLSEEEHQLWLEESLRVISSVTGIQEEDIFLRLRQRKPGRGG